MSVKRKRFEKEELAGLQKIVCSYARICELNRQKEQQLREVLETYIDGRLIAVFDKVGDGVDLRAMRKAVFYGNCGDKTEEDDG